MACAAAITAVDAQEVRKTVTVVFSDLKGSTSLGEALDPESLRDVMGRYFERMRYVLHGHGAAVEKFIGDAVMAVFGLPRVREDDAQRAVRAAWQMQRALQELNDELEPRWGVRLLARIGVNTGEVVAGDAAAGQRLVTGDPVNMAARLEQAAGPGEVLVGESTYRLVRDAVRADPVGPFVVKGKAEPVTAYRLVEVLPAAAAAMRRMDAPMVGRGGELRLLEAALNRAIARKGCELVIVIGEPGMGKSRLLAEFEAGAAGRARVLHAHCPSYGEGITFWPLAEMVRDAASVSGDVAGEGRADLTGASVAALMEGHPQAAAVTARVGSAVGLSAELFPVEEISWATRVLLAHLAKEHPLVLIVEDIHWAEQAFLDLLDHLSDQTQQAPLLLACSARLELPEGWASRPGRQTINLGPLTSEESDRLIANLLDGSGLPGPAQERIQQAAAGNPLFIEQTLSMLADQGYPLSGSNGPPPAIQLSRFPVPASISALLSARLDTLSAEERTVLERASVAGQVFARAAVTELCSPPLRPRIGSCLHALTRKAFVEPDQDSPGGDAGRFRFRHVLIRDAAYSTMLKKLRAQLHERFGGWLEILSRAGPENEELIGYHLEQAYRYRQELGYLDEATRALGDRAGTLLGAAGRRALGRGDMLAAENLLRRAIASLPEENQSHRSFLPYLGAALGWAGRTQEAITILDAAIEEARSAGDTSVEWRAIAERLDIKAGVEWIGEDALAEAERMIPALEEAGDELGLAKAFRLICVFQWANGHLAQAEKACVRGAGHARRSGDPREENEIIAAMACLAFLGPRPAEEAAAICRKLLQQVQGNRHAEGYVRIHLALLEAMQGLPDQARETLSLAEATLAEGGSRKWSSYITWAQGIVAETRGDTEAANRLYLRCDEIDHETAGTYWPEALARRADLLAEAGRSDELQGVIEQLGSREWAEAMEEVPRLSGLARALAAVGRVAEALQASERALKTVESTELLNDHAEVLLRQAAVLRAANRPEEAVTALEEALRLFEQKGNVVWAERTRNLLSSP
jgi:class 3 adenylate cyclase/tetratricopeptide (TPR) repeat protein